MTRLPFVTVISPIFNVFPSSLHPLLCSIRKTSATTGSGMITQVPQYQGAEFGADPGRGTKIRLTLFSAPGQFKDRTADGGLERTLEKDHRMMYVHLTQPLSSPTIYFCFTFPQIWPAGENMWLPSSGMLSTPFCPEAAQTKSSF